jgi:hypothetical protein
MTSVPAFVLTQQIPLANPSPSVHAYLLRREQQEYVVLAFLESSARPLDTLPTSASGGHVSTWGSEVGNRTDTVIYALSASRLITAEIWNAPSREFASNREGNELTPLAYSEFNHLQFSICPRRFQCAWTAVASACTAVGRCSGDPGLAEPSAHSEDCPHPTQGIWYYPYPQFEA